MSRRAITAPIVVGALAGGVTAWFLGSDPAASPRAATSRGASAAVQEPKALPVAPPATAVKAAPRASASNAAPPASVSSAAITPSPAPASVFDLSAPVTEPDLMTAQIGCNRQIPEDCERAGRSLESGSAGVTDAARARGLRRIALTLYVKQCETNRVAACLRLAEMYDAGEIVQANPKNADALRVRAKTLCSTRPGDADCRQ
jgi:hypothetical protein